jgi:UDP-N-acetylglucosamine 2-epimerase (non-hydrolysing)
MKIAPLLAAFEGDESFELILVHTGQHYDDSMSGSFFRDLRIQRPKYHLEVGSGTHAQQTAEIMRRLEPVLMEEKPAGMIVVGDVNSTAAAALVAAKLGITVIHAEAGLRSYDRTMPEEINRIVTDALSDLLLVTEESGRKNLLKEGKEPKQIVMVGNLMVDSLRQNLEQALKSDVRQRLNIGDRRFGLVTLHRPANVDDEHSLCEILGALRRIAEDLDLYWPMHPRTKTRIQQGQFPDLGNIQVIDPLGYLDFLHLQAKATVVLTDSGGVQEESTVLGIPCLTLRTNTERPVTIEGGTNYLAGTRRDTILRAWEQVRDHPKHGTVPPMWDGKAGVRSHDAIRDYFMREEHYGSSQHD